MDLINTYGTRAQVLVLKQYSSVLIDTGVTLTAKAWNGTVGGILGWFCNGTTTITGTINAAGIYASGSASSTHAGGAGIGFRGGTAYKENSPCSGEGNIGTEQRTAGANGSGGGGTYPNGTAAGGGNGTAGTNGNNGATGGLETGNAGLTVMLFGGGGGSGSVAYDAIGCGGGGGGIVFIIGKTITVNSAASVLLSGANGENSTAAGAGGAGGSCLLKGKEIVLDTNKIVSNGGNNGGVGRIHADYSTSISGSTTPTIDSTLDATIVDASSSGASLGGAFLMQFV